MLRVSALLVVCGLAVAGCGGGGDDGPTTTATTATPRTTTTEATTTRADAGGLARGWSVAAALRELPPLPGDRVEVATADLDAATRAGGLRRPSRPTGAAMTAWLGPLTGGPKAAPLFVPLPTMLDARGIAQADQVERELGWSLRTIGAYGEVAAPPYRFLVARDSGRFADGLERLPDGVVSAGRGADLRIDPRATTAARPLGQPLRMARRGPLLAAGPRTATVAAWRAGDPAGTLADDQALASLAARLDAEHVLAAQLLRGNFGPAGVGARATPAQLRELVARLLPQRFDAVGLGWTVDGRRPAIVAVYHFADAPTATEARPALERLWRDGRSTISAQPLAQLVTVEGSSADGDAVTVRLRPGPRGSAATVAQMLVRRDLPFGHR
ncbi:hypothetical protein [Patulibacter defluvii]|uniref:hypothetical protein n=1 Tax=Patulibacter defluvii TaxID=3095358 RepID=UPI002A752033|nr:hypothetical protein [Patulibacter sp. DM4]